MARINCPSCTKTISDKYKQCPHCELDLSEMNLIDQKKMASANLYKKKQKLLNHSFIALFLFLLGFFIMYSRSPEPGSYEMLFCQTAIGAGFIWYLINRIQLAFLKKK